MKIGESELSALLLKNTGFKLIEPHIYSVFSDSDIEVANAYDTEFGNIYDWVACNPFYNRLIWGYSITKFALLTQDALISSKTGNVLDLGCGSLAFTAKTYVHYSYRPVVLMDQSLKMLRLAKSRLIKLNGKVPRTGSFFTRMLFSCLFRKKASIQLSLKICCTVLMIQRSYWPD